MDTEINMLKDQIKQYIYHHPEAKREQIINALSRKLGYDKFTISTYFNEMIGLGEI